MADDAHFSFATAKGWVEKHPYATGAIVFVVGGIIIYSYAYGGGGSTAPAATGAASVAGTGGYAAELAAELQSEQASAAQQTSLTALSDELAANQDSINGQVSIASITGNTDFQLASLNAQTLQDSINVAGGVSSLGIMNTTSIDLASIAAAASIAGLQIGSTNLQDSLTAFTNVTNDYLNTVGEFDNTALLTGALTNETNQNANIEQTLIAKG
jgi:hypothetical protein